MAKQQKPSLKATYPNYGFRASLKILDVVQSYGARKAEVPKSIVAQELKMGEDSSALYALIASAKCYGMVQGNRGLALTEEGERYCYPTTEHDRREAELAFLKAPEAFNFLINRYDGNKLPPQTMLANLLITGGKVPKSWGSRVAGLFVSSATELRVLDEDGFLRYGAATHSNGSRQASEEPSAESVGTRNEPPNEESHKQGITLWKSGMVRVETPELITKDVWDRLRRYVESLKPNAGTKEGR